MKISDYLRWLYFPKRFLYPEKKNGTPDGAAVRIPGWESILLVSDQAQLSEINRHTGKLFLGGAGNEFLRPLFGAQSAFTLDGSQHLLARRLIGKATSKACAEALRGYVDSIVARELDGVSVGQSVHVGLLSRRIAMSAMTKLALNSDDPELSGELFQKLEDTTGYLANPVAYCKALWGERALFGLVKRRVDAIDEIVYPLIAKEQVRQGAGASVIETLVREQAANGYDDVFIRDNLVSIIAAGYDTSGSAITWMLFWLSQPGEFEALLRAESAADYGEHIKSFIFESLRYCPPLEILPRKIERSKLEEFATTIDTRWHNTDATVICPCPHLVHHDSAIFKEPERFDARRFIGKHYTRTEFLTFGTANRVCLGIHIAPMMMQRLLEALLEQRRYFAFKNRNFRPVRRNVSIWPGFRPRARYEGLPDQFRE